MRKILIFFAFTLSQTACLQQKDIAPCCGFPDQLDLLTGTWILEEALYEQEDYTEYWEDFQVTFSAEKTYETQGSIDNVIWPKNGSFDLVGGTGAGLSVINRSDGAILYVDKINDKVLELSLDLGNKGRWVFKLKK